MRPVHAAHRRLRPSVRRASAWAAAALCPSARAGAAPAVTCAHRRALRAALKAGLERRQPKRCRKPVPGPQLAHTLVFALCSAQNYMLCELPQPLQNHAAALRRPGGLTKAAHASATSRALPEEQKRLAIMFGDAWCANKAGVCVAAQGKAGALRTLGLGWTRGSGAGAFMSLAGGPRACAAQPSRARSG